MEATWTKTAEHAEVGTYKPTAIDAKKASSNRLISIDGNYYTVALLGGGNKIMKRREFTAWSKENSYVTDF